MSTWLIVLLTVLVYSFICTVYILNRDFSGETVEDPSILTPVFLPSIWLILLISAYQTYDIYRERKKFLKKHPNYPVDKG